jgi:hypothetical protein
LPSHICCNCTDKLESAYKFKLQVEQADSVLRERLDSLNIKEELFFSHEDVNLSSHRHNIGEITEESLLLKDHMDLLNVEKINERDDLKNLQKETNSIEIEEHEMKDYKIEEKNSHLNQDTEEIKISQDENLQNLNDNQPIHSQDNEQHNQSFGAEVLQEIMLHEINGQERIQELNQTHRLAMYEHNYVAESQTCDVANENHTMNSEVKLD